MAEQEKTSATFAGAVDLPEASDTSVTIRDSRVIAAIFEADQRAEDEAAKAGQPLPYAGPKVTP